jgi:hypothetical protein
MKVFVKTVGNVKHEIEVEASSTVRDVKNRLNAIGPPERLTLIFQGKTLADDETLNGTVNYSEDQFMVAELAEAPAAASSAASIEGDVVFISGATGVYAAEINGTFDRTSEMCDNYPLYVKRGNASMCIQHHKGDWNISSLSNIGKSICSAYVAGGCALEACTSRVWVETDGKGWNPAPGVKMVTGAEAKLQVRVTAGALGKNPPSPLHPGRCLPLAIAIDSCNTVHSGRCLYRRSSSSCRRRQRASAARAHQRRHSRLRKRHRDQRLLRADAGEGYRRACAVRQDRRPQRVH